MKDKPTNDNTASIDYKANAGVTIGGTGLWITFILAWVLMISATLKIWGWI